MKSHVAGALRWSDLLWAPLRLLSGGDRLLLQMRERFAASLGLPSERVWLYASGRGALHALTAALELPPKSEVLLPGYTCVVVPNVFLHLGLPVRYVDIAPGSFNPASEAIAAAIGPQTRLVLLPHNFGLTLEGIAALRRRFPAVVFVEDAAHAWGSRDAAGRPVGTLGQAAFFSFEYSKPLSSGLGGALVIADKALARRVAPRLPRLRRPAASAALKQALTLTWHRLGQSLPGPLLRGLQSLLRGPSRALGVVADTPAAQLSGEARPDYGLALHPLGAALALPQLARGPQLWARRQAQAQRYDALLAGSRRFVVPSRGPGDVLLRYPLRLTQPAERDGVIAALDRLGLVGGTWFDDVVHPRGSYRHGYVPGDCPVGEATAAAVLNLPLGLHADLSEAQARGLRALALGVAA